MASKTKRKSSIKKRPVKTGKKREYEVGYGKPPKDHQFATGNPGGPGRPRTIAELRERIQEIGEENKDGTGTTRLDYLLRDMYSSRNASDKITLLKYGWGNVPEEIRGAWQDELEQLILTQQLTPQEAIEVIGSDNLAANFFKRPRLANIDLGSGRSEDRSEASRTIIDQSAKSSGLDS